MKKLLSIILLLAISLSLVACGEEFEPVPSTKEEAKTVLTVEYDGVRYEVAYELYRAFFLTYKDEIDNGDESVWEGADADDYVKKINEKIFDSIAEIYSAFYLCEKLGIDVYSKSFDEKVEEYISASVDNIIAIYKADAAKENKTAELSREDAYKIYLERLTLDNLNYSASTLLYRYELALAAIDEYYRGEESASSVSGYKDGKLEFTKEDVKGFYDSDDTVKIIHLYMRRSYASKSEAELAREKMIEAKSQAGKDGVIGVILGYSLSGGAEEVENGLLIGKHTLDNNYFSSYTATAFSLKAGEISGVIEAFDGESDGYYVLYRDEKSDGHFEKNYADIVYAYVSNAIGLKKHDAKSGVLNGIKLADGYSDIIHENISM